MSLSRKEFIELSLRGLFIIGLSNSLESFEADSFRLPAKNKIKLRMALASDGHYGQPGTDYDYHHNNMIRWLNEEQRQRGLDFSVINGDLFHNDPQFLPNVKKKWDQLNMPYWVSHGNHDMIDEVKWKATWGTGWYHQFEKNDVGFVILNTADDKGNYLCPDLEWTQKELERLQSKKIVFVIMHITPFNWVSYAINCQELVNIFNQYPNLKGIFHGHNHDQDNVKENAGKHYFFDSHIAGDWGTAYRGYRIVEVLDDDRVLTYQMNAAEFTVMNRHHI